MKKVFNSTLLIILVASVVGCNGTRKRSADLNLSESEIRQQIANLESFVQQDAQQNGTQTIAKAMSSFTKMLTDPTATLFYAETDSSMGPAKTVMPLEWSAFATSQTNPVQSVSKAFAYYVMTQASGTPQGVLILAGNDGKANSNPNQPATNINFIYIMVNDGTFAVPGTGQALPLGEISDTDFMLETNLFDTHLIVLRSEDVVDGDLASVIQFEVNNLEPNGQEANIGYLNMAQPD